MNFPTELKYTQDHEWIRIEGDEAYVGITDFAQKELGDIVFVEVDTLNQEVKKSAVFGTIEAVKTVADLFMPVTGTVLEFNSDIDKNPEFINSDPYQKGWVVKIKINTTSEVGELLDAEAYKKLIGM